MKSGAAGELADPEAGDRARPAEVGGGTGVGGWNAVTDIDLRIVVGEPTRA
jgi:hypothetical protein